MGTPNWANKTIWTGDNLPILRGMNDASVDLIYLDPPFNSKHNYAAPIGSKAAGAAFKDTWTLSDVDVEWINLIEAKHPALHRVILAATTKSDKSYLVYMAARILELHRLLRPTGSLYLHCDPTMSHYLKLVLDAVFGRKQFRNEIVWKRSLGFKRKTAKKFPQKNDILLFYTRSNDGFFAVQYKPHKPEYLRRFRPDESGRLHRDDVNPTGGGARTIYLEDTEGDIIDSVWTDITSINPIAKERLGYPTQKPIRLLQRIIQASSRENEVVLDPFCGCATTLVAADGLGRQWAGIDISSKAAQLIVQRISDQQGALLRELHHRTDLPQRTDLGPIPKYNCPKNRKRLYGEQEGHCAGCQTHFEVRHLEVDHIIAKKHGGQDFLSNLQLLCANCNRIKGDRGMGYLRVKLQL